MDVSECEFFDGSHLCQCDKTIIDEHKKLKNIFSVKYVNCRDNYNCYRKALDEIKEVCKCNYHTPTLEEKELAEDILDIINKAGGNGYEIL